MNVRIPFPITAAVRSELARIVRRELAKITPDDDDDSDGGGGGGGGGGGTIAQVVWDGSWPARPSVPTVWWVGGPNALPTAAEPGDIHFPRAGQE